jgi:hypothetical protein
MAGLFRKCKESTCRISKIGMSFQKRKDGLKAVLSSIGIREV